MYVYTQVALCFYCIVICFFIYYPHISCSAAVCDDPPSIRNGIVTFTGNSIGDIATYTCNPGFELIGDPTTTCTLAVDGNSATYPAVPPPECRRKYFMNITTTVSSVCISSQLWRVYYIELLMDASLLCWT